MADKPKTVKRPRKISEREKRGVKPRQIVTPEMVEEVKVLSGRGLTQEQIHRYYGWSKDVWYARCKEHPELRDGFYQGKAKTISFVAGKLMELVKKGNLSAIIFYLKTQGRFSEHNLADVPYHDGSIANILPKGIDPVEASKVYQQVMLG